MLIFIVNEIVSLVVGRPVVLIPGVPTQTCAYQDPVNYYWILFFPLSVYFLVALVLSAHAVYVCVATSWKVEQQSAGAGKPKGPSYLSKLWSSYGMLIMFLGQYAIFFLPIIVSWKCRILVT